MSKTEGWSSNAAPSPPAGSTSPDSGAKPATQFFDDGAAAPAVLATAPSGTLVFAEPAGAPAAAAPPSVIVAAGPSNLVGTMLRHFSVDRRLASGGMGDVYLGFDTSLSRPVAIKTIRGELARDEDFLARFVREATAQANVVHPHVVQVYFVGEDRGTWFLAMQLVDGGSLHDGLLQGRPMRWQDAARHMTDLCGGLVLAEALGIVHRDIKPANILLDRQGRALLSDFGLAARAGTVDVGATTPVKATGTGSQLQLAQLTQVGVVMGTPEYVAPEQLRVGPLDARADQYALAATFFHLITGTPIVPARRLQEAIERYAGGYRAPPVRSLAPGVPAAFAAVIDRCLETDPARRFQDTQALAEALARAAPQPEVPASAPLRALVWALDVTPFLLVSYLTYMHRPWVGPLLFVLAGVLGTRLLGASPGFWLMRLRLRTVGDGDVSLPRGLARFFLQHGWYIPLTVGWSALYGSSSLYGALVVGAAWGALSILGSFGALFGRRQALHDLVTNTRVLLDVKHR